MVVLRAVWWMNWEKRGGAGDVTVAVMSDTWRNGGLCTGGTGVHMAVLGSNMVGVSEDA